MEGGDTLNPGIEHQQFCDQGLGYPNGGISLPHPDKPGIYVFFILQPPIENLLLMFFIKRPLSITCRPNQVAKKQPSDL